MSEKIKLSIVITAIAAISLGGSLIDTGRMRLFPQAEQKTAQDHYRQPADEHKSPQSASSHEATPITTQGHQPKDTSKGGDAPGQGKDEQAMPNIWWIVVQTAAAIVTAGATFVLAKFASGQFRIYKRQLRIMNRQALIMHGQREIMDKQANIAARQLVTQGPFLEYSICKVEIKASGPDKTALEDYKLSLLLRNSGRDIAVNVAYWQGELFRISGADDPLLSDTTGEHFRDTIFRTEGLPGQMSIGPDGTIDTDQIILSSLHLRALYHKQIRMFVWLVLRYGSRLQANEWFAEVATSLEFVLDRDPETYRLTDKSAEGLPFRVRRAGYRYRESYDRPDGQSVGGQPTMPHDTPPTLETPP